MKLFQILILTFLISAFSACANKQEEEIQKQRLALNLSTPSSEERAMTSKFYETNNFDEIYQASIAVLQDLGFNLETADKELGVITAGKQEDAAEVGNTLAWGLFSMVAMIAGQNTSQAEMIRREMTQKEQMIKVAIITTPKQGRTYVRLNIQRYVINLNDRPMYAETIKEQEIYATIYDKLSKAVFLEANDL